MDAINLADYLLKNIRERISRVKDTLADGSINSFDEYRYLAGQLRGMPLLKMKLKPR